jgi:hypothetical protein
LINEKRRLWRRANASPFFDSLLEAQDDMRDLYLSASRSSDFSSAVIDGYMIEPAR